MVVIRVYRANVDGAGEYHGIEKCGETVHVMEFDRDMNKIEMLWVLCENFAAERYSDVKDARAGESTTIDVVHYITIAGCGVKGDMKPFFAPGGRLAMVYDINRSGFTLRSIKKKSQLLEVLCAPYETVYRPATSGESAPDQKTEQPSTEVAELRAALSTARAEVETTKNAFREMFTLKQQLSELERVEAELRRDESMLAARRAQYETDKKRVKEDGHKATQKLIELINAGCAEGQRIVLDTSS